MLTENDPKLIDAFNEFLSIYKLINRQGIVDILNTELGGANREQLIEIYQLTDGDNSTREISAKLKNKCSHVTISKLWNKWALIGIAKPVKQKGRFKAAFNLIEYGISVSEIEEE